MEPEDDDLNALRSAALASLSSKPKVEVKKPEEDEDLESLRLAALMTRKQNQKIQVIYQQPAPQQVQFFQPPVFQPHRPPPWAGQSMNRPPLFQRHRLPWPGPSVNLISLTPDPNTAGMRPRQRFSRPMPSRPRAPQPYTVRAPPPVTVPKPTAENKVPDKFSRYNSDSSSDDDEENADKKKTTQSDDENHSDAESVTSKKSFSSVSDVGDTDKDASKDAEIEVKETEDVQGDEDESGNESDADSGDAENVASDNDDDNISITGVDEEEDDILAAIDDYLEDRPTKPKKVPEKNVKKDASKVGKAANTKKKVDVKENKQHIKPTRQSNDSKPKVALKVKAPEAKVIPPKTANEPAPPVSNVGPATTSDVRKKPQIRETTRRGPERPDVTKSRAAGPPPRDWRPEGRHEPTRTRKDEMPPQYRPERGRNVPVVALSPMSPPRQRRDSDLDSVGTSDLSFLSSDSEDEDKKNMPQPEVKPKVNRVRTRSMSSEDRRKGTQNLDKQRNERSGNRGVKPVRSQEESRMGKKTSPNDRDTRPQPQATVKPLLKEGDARQRLSRPNTGGDLRKKLETKGLPKKPPAEKTEKGNKKILKEPEKGAKAMPERRAFNKNSPHEPTKSLSPVRKTGVISLKKKSTRIPAPAKSWSRETSPEVSLPDLSEARRIIITRPNTLSGSKATIKLQRTEVKSHKRIEVEPNDEPTSKFTTAKRKRSIVERSKIQKPKTNEDTQQSGVRNRKRSVLPPNIPTEEKKQKIKEIMKKESPKREKWERESPDEEDSRSEEDAGSSSGEEIIDEEVFTVDDSALPAYDDVLGNFDVEEEGEYYEDNSKKQKISSSSKSRKKPEKIGQRQSSRKNVPDSRRIVPKSSPERFSDDDSVDRDSESKYTVSKNAIHRRLGTRQAETKVVKKSPIRSMPEPRSRPGRRWSGSTEGSYQSLRWSENESDNEFSLEPEQQAQNFTKKQASAVKVAASIIKVAPRRKDTRDSEEEHYDFIEERSSSKERRSLKSEKESKKRKRKIMLAGRKEKEQPSGAVSKIRKVDKKSRGRTIKDRLGKVILTSVLPQPRAEPDRKRLVNRDTRQGDEVVQARSKSNKRHKKVKDRRGEGGKAKKEDVLEARIQRIKQQNGQILRRQKEIEMEKEKFGF